MGKKDRRKRRKPRKKFQETEPLSDENFAFIAGYTPGGMPYGLTHEEMRRIEESENNQEVLQGSNLREMEEAEEPGQPEEMNHSATETKADDLETPEMDLPF